MAGAGGERRCWVASLESGAVAASEAPWCLVDDKQALAEQLWQRYPVRRGYSRRCVFQGWYAREWEVWGLENDLDAGEWDAMIEMDRLTLWRVLANAPYRLLRFPLVMRRSRGLPRSVHEFPLHDQLASDTGDTKR